MSPGSILHALMMPAHTHADPSETASSAVNAGVIILALVVAVAAVFMIRMALKRSSASRIPCPECGRYLGPAEDQCPFCSAKIHGGDDQD